MLGLAFARAAEAQPGITSISGVVTHGNTVVLSGNGFGSKTAALPLVWTNFDTGTLHPSLTPHGEMIYNNANNLRHPFATFNARADFKQGPRDGYYLSYDAATAPKWFVQYWVKLAPNWHWGTSTFAGPDDGLANVKFMRFFPLGARNYSNVMYNIQGFNGFAIMRETENAPGTSWFGDARTLFSLDMWHSVQVEYGENTGVDQADGTIKLWIDGVLVDRTTTLITNASSDGVAVNKRPYHLGFYDSWSPSDSADPQMYAYYSDIYVDNTWARVEIGNANIYDACTRRETQIPTGWADSSLILQVNQGAFLSGQTVYVYVVDANGQVNSNGFPVVIDGGHPQKPISAPSGLQIVK